MSRTAGPPTIRDFDYLALIGRKDEQPYGRGQIAVLSMRVDTLDQLGQRRLALRRNLFQSSPERLFETDAGFVTTNDDGSFGH